MRTANPKNEQSRLFAAVIFPLKRAIPPDNRLTSGMLLASFKG
jgi:hypothetical protein